MDSACVLGKVGEAERQLRQDERDQISWARDGKRGAAVSLFYLPVADPDAGTPPDYDSTPSLILIADHGVGIGNGAGCV